MKKIALSIMLFTAVVLFNLFNSSYSHEKSNYYSKKQTINENFKNEPKEINEVVDNERKGQRKFTFIEFGSVRCIPCQKMQPIMRSLEKRYGDQLEVIFYDFWTIKDRDKAKEYNIKLIPTQIFLDEKGVEFHRHEGFYPEEEIDKILISKGLKPNK